MTPSDIRKKAEEIAQEVLSNKDAWWLQADEIEAFASIVRNQALDEAKEVVKHGYEMTENRDKVIKRILALKTTGEGK